MDFSVCTTTLRNGNDTQRPAGNTPSEQLNLTKIWMGLTWFHPHVKEDIVVTRRMNMWDRGRGAYIAYYCNIQKVQILTKKNLPNSMFGETFEFYPSKSVQIEYSKYIRLERNIMLNPNSICQYWCWCFNIHGYIFLINVKRWKRVKLNYTRWNVTKMWTKQILPIEIDTCEINVTFFRFFLITLLK